MTAHTLPTPYRPRRYWRLNWTALAIVAAGFACWVIPGGIVCAVIWGPR